MVSGNGRISSISAVPASGVRLLHPAEQTLEAMLDGWRNQQLSRNLSFGTIGAREAMVRRFQADTNEFPWAWTAVHVDEWFMDARAVRRVAHSTLRSYQGALRTFMAYLTDPAYDWPAACVERFGTHPVQICHEWNTASHVSDSEAKPTRRALGRRELQELLDLADSRVADARAHGTKGALTAFRDAVMFKVAYGWGLRRNEVRMLDVTDFGVNPKAPEFDELGVVYVNYGKAMRGSPPKRRSVLTVFDWAAEVLAEWLTDIRPQLAVGDTKALFPSERGGRIGLGQMNARFAQNRKQLGLADGIGMHSLRHSYVTHLIEDGWDARFVQLQVGHEHASTTSLYTSVSSDYRTSMVRAALDRTMAAIDDSSGVAR